MLNPAAKLAIKDCYAPPMATYSKSPIPKNKAKLKLGLVLINYDRSNIPTKGDGEKKRRKDMGSFFINSPILEALTVFSVIIDSYGISSTSSPSYKIFS